MSMVEEAPAYLVARQAAEAERQQAARKKELAAERESAKKQAVVELRRLAEFPSSVTPEEIRATATLALQVLGNRGKRLSPGQQAFEEE